MSSEENQEEVRTLKVILGENTHTIEIPDIENPGKITSLKLHRLTLTDLAKLEDKTGIPYPQWEDKSPFSSISNMLFAIWCSMRRNQGFLMTQDEVGDMFALNEEDFGKLFQIVNIIMKLTGIAVADPKKVQGGQAQESA